MTEKFDIEIIDSTNEIEIVDVPTSTTEISEEETYTPVEYSEWSTPEDFESYVVASARNVPPVFADSKNSYRRAFAYLERLSEEIVEGVQQDASFANLNEVQLKNLDLVEEGIEEALKDISAAAEGKVTKTATKSSAFTTFVNPFIFGLARTIINGKVNAGKNIEALYGELNKRYKLNDREQLELYYCLNDMGHAVRSSFVEGLDRAENYYA